MKRLLKIFSFLMIIGCVLFLASCNNAQNNTTGSGNSGSNPTNTQNPSSPTNPSNPSKPTDGNEELEIYSFAVTNVHGKELEGFYIELLLDGKTAEYQFTDNLGYAEFYVKPAEYEVFIEPTEGYTVQADYENIITDVVGTHYDIVCDSKLIKSEAPDGHKYESGEVMYDFTVIDALTQKEITLSKMLEEKEVVFINFWYMTCTYCMQEFPIMHEAYISQIEGTDYKYSDKVGFICINPGLYPDSGDTAQGVLNFANTNKYTFPIAMDNFTKSGAPILANMFSCEAFPTTAVIDRYGVISDIEDGAILEVAEWQYIFNEFIGDDYIPTYTPSGSESVERIEPNISHPEAGVLEAVVNGNDLAGNKMENTYYPDEDMYNWPFIVDETMNAIKPANTEISNSYAIIYSDITLKEGDVLALDYFASSEKDDILYVFIDRIIVAQLSGLSTEWESQYIYPAIKDGTYELAFAYVKDNRGSEFDDCVYIRNLRIVKPEDIDKPTYIQREASYGEQNLFTSSYQYYIEPVYNEQDGYYHVGSVNGPLLLADLNSGTHWSNTSLYERCQEPNGLMLPNGRDYTDFITKYTTYLGNTSIGYIPINQQLKDALVEITYELGADAAKANDKQWLEVCVYYNAYGGAPELESPVTGIAPFEAYQFDSNNTAVGNYAAAYLPRGIYFEFKPESSGIYKFYSTNNDATIGWAFDENDNYLKESEFGILGSLGTAADMGAGSFILYSFFEAGKTYYIKVAFDNYDTLGEITIKYEYVAAFVEIFKLASPGFFTYDENSSGNIEDMDYTIIAGGVDVEFNESDGYYHTVGQKSKDTKIYANFLYTSAIFEGMNLKNIADLGGFDFTKDENGALITYETGEPMFDAEGYALDINGNRLVNSEGDPINYNKTSVFEKYYAMIETDRTLDTYGCLPVNKELAETLQMLMDKYTFPGVETSWRKLCYYYEYIGA